MLASIVDRSFVSLLFGLAHRLLLGHPHIQLLALNLIEGSWIYVRLKLNRSQAYENRLLVSLWIIEGFIRVFLILSLFLYEEYEILRLTINEFHAELISWYIYVILIEFSVSTLELLKETFNSFKKIYVFSSGTKQKQKGNDVK